MKDFHDFTDRTIEDLYHRFAADTALNSPTWSRLCSWIATTPEVVRRLDTLPGNARQPNRFLGAVRYLGGPVEPGDEFARWLEERWSAISEVTRSRTTQTNEPGRCAGLAPVLAALPQPVSLIELGSSAGLCLFPDRYRYRFTGTRSWTTQPQAAGAQAPELCCELTGTLPADPANLVVAARLGVDLNPLDATDPDVAAWLRALVWPDEPDREQRLAAALDIAAGDPPTIVREDLSVSPGTLIPRLVDRIRAEAPHATPVVFHAAALVYLSEEARGAVIAAIRETGAHWLSAEGHAVIEVQSSEGSDQEPHIALALDGLKVGRMHAHGRWVAYA